MTLTLTVEEGPHKGEQFNVPPRQECIIGRSAGADVRLPRDASMSQLHLRLTFQPPLCRIVDLASRNGVRVNGRLVLRTDLQDGDLVQCGQTSVRVALQRQPCGPAPADITLTIPAELFPGYHLLATLGSGGMGVVYLARRLADNASVALKTCKLDQSGIASPVERFLVEASILRNLVHPNIVAFHEIGFAHGKFFFVMEYVPGLDMIELVARKGGPLPVGLSVGLACQILDALAYAMTKNLVHRDIKPRNVMVTEVDGRQLVKLTDFGLARMYQTSCYAGQPLKGGMGGSLGFMAPEQLEHFHEAKSPADQYGVAATLYYLLTTQMVYDFPGDFMERMTIILTQDPVPIRQRLRDIPERLAQVIHQALARDPARRFADVVALRQALLPFVDRI
jgi:serine/threonine protein kinase